MTPSPEGHGHWLIAASLRKLFENRTQQLLGKALKHAEERKNNSAPKLPWEGRCLEEKGRGYFRLCAECRLDLQCRNEFRPDAIRIANNNFRKGTPEVGRVTPCAPRALPYPERLWQLLPQVACGGWLRVKDWKSSIMNRIVEMSGWRPWIKFAEHSGNLAEHPGNTSKAPR